MDRESTEHFLSYCSRYKDARSQLFDAVTEGLAATSSTTRNKRFHINEELLLSPACNSKLIRRYRNEILAALFVLTAATQRKLREFISCQ